MNKHTKTIAPAMPVLDTEALGVIMPPAPEVVPPVQPETPVEEVTVINRPKFEQDEKARAEKFDAALEEMALLGAQAALGGAALTNAGITATRLVWENSVNDAHVEQMYARFAGAFNARAKGGERMDGADKSAISRFRTFFKPEVVAFVHGRGMNFNWHDKVADIRDSIEDPKNRKGSLYNALVLFNREIVKAEKAAPNVITEEFVLKLITADEPKAKSDLQHLAALAKAAESCGKKTGLVMTEVEAAIEALRVALAPAETK